MINLTDENFENEIQQVNKPVLVDFSAVWCPPCATLTPILEKIEEAFKERIIFAKVNVDLAPKTSQKFRINPIPTVILFKNGKPVSGFVGVRPEALIRDWLENVLKENGKDKIGKLVKEYEEYAQKNGFKLNPNKKVVEGVIKGLLEREKKFGFRYCPCRRATGNKEEDSKIICPCSYHRQEIERDGHCLCGLFFKA